MKKFLNSPGGKLLISAVMALIAVILIFRAFGFIKPYLDGSKEVIRDINIEVLMKDGSTQYYTLSEVFSALLVNDITIGNKLNEIKDSINNVNLCEIKN